MNWEKTIHISQGIIKDERKSKYIQLNLFWAEFKIHAGIWIKSNKIRQANRKSTQVFMHIVRLLSLRVAFFFEVASWLRKYSHTGVEINHACHPHAASLRCPAVGYLLWCVMAAVWSCLSSVSGLFQWLFPLHSKRS